MELTTFAPAAAHPLHEAPVTYSPLLPTGVDVVDRVWGGLYRGGSYLLYGRGASGRDLLTLRFTQTGAELGESCLFISTARPKDLMIQAASIGFDLREAYEQEKVKLLRVPPTLAHQGGEDVGVLRAMRDLVALIREHRPQRLVVNDFMPFVMFRSYDRLRASIVDLLEQTDVLDMTMILMMSEPGNEQSRRVVDFVASQMTGAVHLEMVSEDQESTLRRLTFQPNIGHVRGRRTEPWDLADMLKPVTVPVQAARRMLPAPPQMPEPPRSRGIRLGSAEAAPAPTPSVVFKPLPAPDPYVAPRPSPSYAAPEPYVAPAPYAAPEAPRAPEPYVAPEMYRTPEPYYAPEPYAAPYSAPATAAPAFEAPMFDTPTPAAAPAFVWTPEPPAPAPTAAPIAEEPGPVAGRASLRPGATSLRSGPPRQAEMHREVPTFGTLSPEPVAAWPVVELPVMPAPQPLPSAPAPVMPPQGMAPGSPYGTPAPSYAPYAAAPETPAAMPVNPYASPAYETTQPPVMPAPQAPPMPQGSYTPPPAPVPHYHQAPPAAPQAPYAQPPTPAPAPMGAMPMGSGYDRASFGQLLDEQFRLRNLQNTPFLLVALRLEAGSTSPFGFDFVRELLSRSLRAQDALLADARGERLVVLLPGAQPEEAGALFTRFKGRLRDEAPYHAEALLNAVSAIVLRNGEATTGEAFRDANAVLAYVLDNG